jgi:hypothetical protein
MVLSVVNPSCCHVQNHLCHLPSTLRHSRSTLRHSRESGNPVNTKTHCFLFKDVGLTILLRLLWLNLTAMLCRCILYVVARTKPLIQAQTRCAFLLCAGYPTHLTPYANGCIRTVATPAGPLDDAEIGRDFFIWEVL